MPTELGNFQLQPVEVVLLGRSGEPDSHTLNIGLGVEILLHPIIKKQNPHS